MAIRYPRLDQLPGFDAAILDRYLRVVQVNREPDCWSQQRPEQYGVKFPRQQYRELTDRKIALMLWQHLWIACVAPGDGHTDRIVIDLDADDVEAERARNTRYTALRELFGSAARPLVHGTPSGHGLRLVYRIPRTPLDELVTGRFTGLVADVIRGAGLPVEDGQVEVYPQTGRPDRLPLGRRMPLLSPDTLAPLPHAHIGDGFSLDALLGGLEEIERWHAAPAVDLLPHLRTLPRVEPLATYEQPTSGDPATAPTAASADVAPAAEQLIRDGLTGGSQRQRAEWIVGSAFLRAPTTYGLPATPTVEQIAEAVAVWLSEKNNGKSKDWNHTLAMHGGDAEASIRAFMAAYLTRSSRGHHFVDRLRSAAAAQDASFRRVLGLSEAEARAVLALAERHYKAGAMRYRFEVWLFAWLRDVKKLMLATRRAGPEQHTYLLPPDGHPREAVVLEISAKRMRKLWPHGSGGNGARYKEFRAILHDEWIMRRRKPHRRKGYKGAERDFATRYAVPLRVPNLDVLLRDLPADPRRVLAAVDGLTVKNRPVTLHHVMHALQIAQVFPKWQEREAQYGRASAERMAKIVRAVRARLAETPTATPASAVISDA